MKKRKPIIVKPWSEGIAIRVRQLCLHWLKEIVAEEKKQ